MTDEPVGRRERKKALTRKTISDAATMMFLERGFDAVSIREIAERADVSPTTVFAHFPQKEALVFDEDEAQRDRLVAVVRERAAGTSISAALHEYYRSELSTMTLEHGDDSVRIFMDLIESTPSLADYAQRMWVRHEDALADVIAAESGLAEPDDAIRVYARFVLQIQILAMGHPAPIPMVDAAFRLLDGGWDAYLAGRG